MMRKVSVATSILCRQPNRTLKTSTSHSDLKQTPTLQNAHCREHFLISLAQMFACLQYVHLRATRRPNGAAKIKKMSFNFVLSVQRFKPEGFVVSFPASSRAAQY